VTTRIRYNTAQRATGNASVKIEGMPRACEMTASELRTRAAALTVSASGEFHPRDPQINTQAIESFMQAAQPSPFSAVRKEPI